MTAIPRPFKVLSSRIVWSCPWYQVRQDDIITPDGQPGVYNVIEKAEAVWIVPVTHDGFLAMVYQYRHTVDDWCWEIPAGSVKPGYSLVKTAHEELHEEVGGTAEKLEYIGRFYLANGICNEVGHIFLATGVTLGETRHEAAEVMQVHRQPIGETLQRARAGLISDGPTALALLLCADKLQGLATEARPDGI
jgi:ADP-ribose pyrophosphatase